MGEKKRYAIELTEDVAQILKVFFPSIKEGLETALEEWLTNHEQEVKVVEEALRNVRKSKKK